jgi:hypothetical protein
VEHVKNSGPGISVGIATDYGLEGPGIESRCGRDFSPVQTGLGANPSSCKMGTGSFPGVKYDRGVLLTTHPLLVSWSWKIRAIVLPTLWATTGPVTGKHTHTHKHTHINTHTNTHNKHTHKQTHTHTHTQTQTKKHTHKHTHAHVKNKHISFL